MSLQGSIKVQFGTVFPDGFSSFRISRAGRSAAFKVALPAAGQRALD